MCIRDSYDTVHTVNAADYTPAQLDAWAPGKLDESRWNESLLGHDSWVALWDGEIAGFADMDGDGYLDRLYVGRRFQGRGVAGALCSLLEGRSIAPVFTTHALSLIHI